MKGPSPVPLLFLCDYFQMDDNFISCVEDYSKNVSKEMASEEELHLLYEDIIDFRTAGLIVERGQHLISQRCYEKNELLTDSQLNEIADLPLWLDIASIIEENRVCTKTKLEFQIKEESKGWSRDIVYFLENNENASAVDLEAFQKLTGETTLPYVDVNAALVLLKEEHKHVSTMFRKNPSDLTSVQKRCVESFVDAELELEDNEELRAQAIDVMSTLPHVMGSYLKSTLKLFGEEKIGLKKGKLICRTSIVL